MKFDKLEHSRKFVSNPGSRFREMFHGVVQEDGSIELVSDGFKDVVKEMQLDAVGTDLPSIIARATAGDPSAFRRDAAFYGDVVGMPKTYAEILNTVNEGKEKFERLPVEVKEAFNYSFDEWFATAGTDTWYEKLGFKKGQARSEVESEVKSDES